MAYNGKKSHENTPEARFYRSLVGERVQIRLDGEASPQEVTLVWVDRYSIGLRINGREVLHYKQWIKTIEHADGKRQHGDYRRATS